MLDVLLTPIGFSLFLLVWMLCIILFIILLKTPALVFLVAMLSKKSVIVNPTDSKLLSFLLATPQGSLNHVKGKGYYIVDPDDVYIESRSKTPMSINYGKFAISINPKMAKVVEKLKSAGIRNYNDLVNLIEDMKAKGEDMNVIVMGESINLSKIVDYFARDERGDFIESEIQRRTAAQVMKKLGAGDIFKWAVILVIVAIGLAFAYAIVTSLGGGGGGAGTPLPGIPTVITNVTAGTGLG